MAQLRPTSTATWPKVAAVAGLTAAFIADQLVSEREALDQEARSHGAVALAHDILLSRYPGASRVCIGSSERARRRYMTAMAERTADPEAILRRFTRTNVQHPTYKGLAELGKAVKTVFLCRYLADEALRRSLNPVGFPYELNGSPTLGRDALPQPIPPMGRSVVPC